MKMKLNNILSFQRNVNLSSKLNENGLKTTYYHSGITKKIREEIQSKWLMDDIKIIPARNCFWHGY